ncbi:hypothetical protein ASG67_05920 [Sphingomonas sp. Leaf339]|uniref:PEPxxWA-CTERM sorting domain-containing protein n=1 Tax=Sphingomonas sp. Leaf339 TaxID=1736343 RepID=UPI0006FAF5C2|nr:PEPxxWA-CTERM sorting domain-containing protein [Sphingomonas sp. Leaf339]KQU55674.1 hypothetical protein ASG67_05920 [Sphingomonas sp. Leaf339]
MKILSTMALAIGTAAIVPATAHAAQFQASGDIFTGTGFGSRYVGPGGTASPSNRAFGSAQDGGADTFDNFGFFNSGLAGLTLSRQVELLDGNVFRFFDTFTNTGRSAISTTVNFFGNLGSDGDEIVSTNSAGLIVSCQDDGDGNCTEDAVLALVSGNNGLAQAAITADRYNARFMLNVAAGESVNLLNFAFLARDENGPLASDVTLAQTTGAALLAAPRTDGLTATQIGRIVNFSVSAVPEPASWMMMIAGFGAIGIAMRRRRAARITFAV